MKKEIQPPVSADEAVAIISSSNRVFVQGGAATPQVLVKAMTRRARDLRNVEVVHLHTEGFSVFDSGDSNNHDAFKVNCFFVGSNVRKAVQSGHAQYIPVFLSEVPSLFRKNILPLDVAIIHVSAPDKHGNCSMGVTVDIALSAVQEAKYIIAQVNPRMPRTFGDGLIHMSKFHAHIEVDELLPEVDLGEPSPVESAIGTNVASLVENGATLQMGIGGIPNAVLKSLENHKNLGIHTEMFSDGVIELVDKGVITGKHKRVHPRKIVSGFAMGTQKLYDFMDENIDILMLDIAYVNDTAVIRRNPKVTAINSAIEIDLTGQVCADSIGSKIFSGVGGQMDFIRGASLSEGGKPIIGLASTTKRGESKIVPMLKPGAGVVTTRAHVHYVVTEYGVANLFGKNLAQRAKSLIEIAHPDHREKLEKEAFNLYGNGF